LPQAELAGTKMSPLEEAKGDLGQEWRVRVSGQPGRDSEQPTGVVGAEAAFRPWTVQLGVFEDPNRIGQSGQVVQSRRRRHRLVHAAARAAKTSAMSER